MVVYDQFVSIPGTPGSPLQNCFSSQSPPCTGAGSVIPSQVQDFAFPFIELHDILVDPLVQANGLRVLRPL